MPCAMPSFQSTPVIANGRIVRSGVFRSTFQSTPVIANGRIHGAGDARFCALLFQSTPVIANGRIALADAFGSLPIDVSIHARYC